MIELPAFSRKMVVTPTLGTRLAGRTPQPLFDLVFYWFRVKLRVLGWSHSFHTHAVTTLPIFPRLVGLGLLELGFRARARVKFYSSRTQNVTTIFFGRV